MNRKTQRPLTLLLLASGMSGLSACGLQGDLTRPDPLWGTPDAIPAAERTASRVTDGLTDLREAEREEEAEDETPDAEDELLGGPSLR